MWHPNLLILAKVAPKYAMWHPLSGATLFFIINVFFSRMTPSPIKWQNLCRVSDLHFVDDEIH